MDKKLSIIPLAALTTLCTCGGWVLSFNRTGRNAVTVIPPSAAIAFMLPMATAANDDISLGIVGHVASAEDSLLGITLVEQVHSTGRTGIKGLSYLNRQVATGR